MKNLISFFIVFLFLCLPSCARKGTEEERTSREISELHEEILTQGVDKECSAIKKLEKLGEPAVETLIELLKHEDWHVSCSSAMALGRIGDQRAFAPLLWAFVKGDKPLPNFARIALVKLDHSKANDAFVEVYLDHPENDDLKARILSSGIIKHMIENLRSGDERVKEISSIALEEITKLDFDEDYEKWKKWFEDNQRRFTDFGGSWYVNFPVKENQRKQFNDSWQKVEERADECKSLLKRGEIKLKSAKNPVERESGYKEIRIGIIKLSSALKDGDRILYSSGLDHGIMRKYEQIIVEWRRIAEKYISKYD